MSTRVFVGGLSYRVRERDLERFFRKYGNVRDISMKNGYAFVEFEDYRDADDAVYELNGKDLMGERVIVEHARGTDRSRRSRDRFGGGYGGGRRRWERVSVERARGTPRGSDRWRDFGGKGSSGDRDRGWSRIEVPPLRRRGRSPPRRDRDRYDRRDRGPRNDRYGPPTRTEYRVIVENLSSRVSWQDLKDYMRQAGEVTYADAHKNRRNEGVVEFISSADMKTAIEKLDGAELNGRKIRLIEDKGSRRRRSRSSSGSRSRSRSRSRRSRSRHSSRSRSRSKSAGSRSKSRSRSKAKAERKSRSKSPAKKVERSRSKSPSKNGGGSKDRSASRSRSRSRSQSPAKGRDRSKSHSATPKDKD